MAYGIILLVGTVLQIGLRLFLPDPPPPGTRWFRLALALVMLWCLVMMTVDDYRDRRRRKAAAGRAPGDEPGAGTAAASDKA